MIDSEVRHYRRVLACDAEQWLSLGWQECYRELIPSAVEPIVLLAWRGENPILPSVTE